MRLPVVQLASDPMRAVTAKSTLAPIPTRLGTIGLYVPVTRTAICWWNVAVVHDGLPLGSRLGGLAYRSASGTANTSTAYPVMLCSIPHIPVPYARPLNAPVRHTATTSAVVTAAGSAIWVPSASVRVTPPLVRTTANRAASRAALAGGG